MSNICQRLVTLRETLRLNQSNLATSLEIKRPTLAGYEKGTFPPSTDFMVKIRETYGVNIDWLLTGEGGMFLGEKPKESPEKETHPIVSSIDALVKENLKGHLAKLEESLMARIEAIEERLKPGAKPETEYSSETTEYEDYVAEPKPKYGGLSYWNDVAAGPPVPQHPDEWEQIVYVPMRLIKTKLEDYYVMRVRGNSMIDALIPDGSMIMLRWSNAPRHGAIQAVWIDDKVTLKRMMEDENHGWTLRHEDGSGRTVPLGEGNYVVGDFVAVLPPSTKPRIRGEE